MIRPRYALRNHLTIDKLITFYYKELSSEFTTRGERHNFWEFVYVDKGKIEIITDSRRCNLSQGDIIFYKPNEFHAGRAIDNASPNLIIISFECHDPCMEFFEDKTFQLDEEERVILSRLIHEGNKAFDPPVDSPNMTLPSRRSNAPFGSEQLIKNYLEILLVLMIRKGDLRQESDKPSTTISENREANLVEQIIVYMKENIRDNLTPEQLCDKFAISRTQLMTMFKSKTDMGVIEYFNILKIDKAKEMIRSKQYNFTEIAEFLSYSSVHYFSRKFKSVTNMTPTEYARSVRAR